MEMQNKSIGPHDHVRYARKCDVTGEGMNEGYCIGEGDMYIKYEKDMIKHIRKIDSVDNKYHESDMLNDKLSDEWLLQDYYQHDYYYYTHWGPEDYLFEEILGVLTEIK
tara:strand:+ start:565 stop:891 length:327 start_codon:yes stop_codon:yes gene_type:complete